MKLTSFSRITTHRTMARAALYADFSLATRPIQYNRYKIKAQILETPRISINLGDFTNELTKHLNVAVADSNSEPACCKQGGVRHE